jgi:hypothetical protein
MRDLYDVSIDGEYLISRWLTEEDIRRAQELSDELNLGMTYVKV